MKIPGLMDASSLLQKKVIVFDLETTVLYIGSMTEIKKSSFTVLNTEKKLIEAEAVALHCDDPQPVFLRALRGRPRQSVTNAIDKNG